MAINQHKPLPPAIIETDRASLLALKTLSDYAPPNPAIRVEALEALEARLRQAEAAEILANNAQAAAQAARIAVGWDLHNAVLSAKAAVICQYGNSSDVVRALGLKRKSDYRRPARRLNAER